MTIREFRPNGSIWLDYVRAADDPKLLVNLSAAAMAGRFLWTTSDEGRTVEILEPVRSGFRLREQISLDDVFSRLPGEKKGDEVDLESIDVANGTVWICGSHCRVRRKPSKAGTIEPRFRDRRSRCLLGCSRIASKGATIELPGTSLPFKGPRSLRQVLRQNAYIAPFIHLPSKENGLDIEGLCVLGKRLFLGLRGPLIDSIAIIVELPIVRGAVVMMSRLAFHLVDLGGLAVRDLARNEDGIIVLAGPVSSSSGPFRLYRWVPRRTRRAQTPAALREWPRSTENPEAICRFDRNGKRGLMVLYDSPTEARIQGSRYRADWISLGGAQ